MRAQYKINKIESKSNKNKESSNARADDNFRKIFTSDRMTWIQYCFQCRITAVTIWQKRHMPRAPRFWGPRAYSLLFPPRVFCSLFHRGAQQCASAEPQRAQVPRSQKAGPQTVFFVPCFIVSARGPKEPKVRKKRQAPKLKNRGPKERGPKRFFVPCFNAGLKQCADPKSPRPPKAKLQNKERGVPKFKKRGSRKAGPQTNFSVPSLGKGLQKARP